MQTISVYSAHAAQAGLQEQKIAEGSLVNVRIVSSNGEGKYIGIVAGVRVNLKSDSVLQNGDVFKAKISIKNNTIFLKPVQNKTFYSWKKRQNEIIANYKPNFIDYMKGKNEELYDELTDNLGLTDDEIFDIALEAAKQGQYKESDQLISGVAKHFNLDDLVEKQVIDINKFK